MAECDNMDGLKPLTVLNQAMNSPVIVELRGGKEYHGILDGYDPHMNVVLRNVEYIHGDSTERFNKIILRGDNVIYISP